MVAAQCCFLSATSVNVGVVCHWNLLLGISEAQLRILIAMCTQALLPTSVRGPFVCLYGSVSTFPVSAWKLNSPLPASGTAHWVSGIGGHCLIGYQQLSAINKLHCVHVVIWVRFVLNMISVYNKGFGFYFRRVMFVSLVMEMNKDCCIMISAYCQVLHLFWV